MIKNVKKSSTYDKCNEMMIIEHMFELCDIHQKNLEYCDKRRHDDDDF